MRAFEIIILAAVLAAGTAQADGFRLRTEIGVNGAWDRATSPAAALGFQNRRTNGASARLMWSKTLGGFRLEVHSIMAVAQGGDVAYANALGLTPVPATLFNLTQSWQNSASRRVTNTIDRLSLTYTNASLVVRVGRQAITWGGGTVFHPADIVAPFAPNAADTTYKTGADMVYAQYLFDSGADIQAIAVPRGVTLGGPVVFAASTYALRGHSALGSLDGNLMLARDRGDSVAALGLSGALGGAAWNAEYIHWALSDGTHAPSWLLNISNFGVLFGRNISYFGEVYHSGFGVAASVPVVALPATLTKKLATGQVFFAGRDFFAAGLRVELTPDASVAPGAIVSLGDGSALASLSADYALGDNTNIAFTYSQPIGATGTEFGGRETSAGSGVFSGPAKRVALTLVRYF